MTKSSSEEEQKSMHREFYVEVQLEGKLGKDSGVPLGVKRRPAFLEWNEQKGEWWAMSLHSPVHTQKCSHLFYLILFSPLPWGCSLVVAVFYRNTSWGSQWILTAFVKASYPVTGGAIIRSSDIRNHTCTSMLFREPVALVILGYLPRAHHYFYIKDPEEMN